MAYKLREQEEISLGFRQDMGVWQRDETIYQQFTDYEGKLYAENARRRDERSDEPSRDINLDYTRKFGAEGKQLDFSIAHSHGDHLC